MTSEREVKERDVGSRRKEERKERGVRTGKGQET